MKQQRRYRAYMMTVTADLKDIDDLYMGVLQLVTRQPATKYAIIKHDRDEGSDHYHVALHLQNGMTITALSKALDTPPNFIQKWDGRVNNMWSYMTHATTLAKNEKADYSDYITNHDKFRTNIEDYDDIVKRSARNARRAQASQHLDDIVDKILTGDITKTQLLRPDMIKDYYENYVKIERAIRLRTESLRTNPPDNTTLLIHGDSGVGKSYAARNIAQTLYPDNYIISSSANDPLQDYAGEKCLIIDDFRPDTYDFIDLLALLDPSNRQRSHRSRYYNKPIGTEMIIMTSIFSLDDILRYYKNLHPREDMKQLRRRIQQVTHIVARGQEETLLYNEQLDIYE